MKRLIAGFCVFLLCGCVRVNQIEDATSKQETPQVQKENKDKKQVVTCHESASSNIKFTASGDEITSLEKRFDVSLEDLGVTESLDPNKIQDTINERLVSLYENTDGVEASSSIEGSVAHVLIEIDFSKADMSKLIEEGLLNEGQRESQYVSLDQSIELYESNGYVCDIE